MFKNNNIITSIKHFPGHGSSSTDSHLGMVDVTNSYQEKEIIKTIISGRSAVGSEEPYRFGFSKADNSLVSIGVGKDFTHFFKDSSIETDEYRVYNPFPVPNMESCIMEFFKCQDGTTWIRTISNISVSSIICTEKVELIDSSIEDFNFN